VVVLYREVTSSELVALQGNGLRVRSEVSPDGLAGWLGVVLQGHASDNRGIDVCSGAQTGLGGGSSAQVDSAA